MDVEEGLLGLRIKGRRRTLVVGILLAARILGVRERRAVKAGLLVLLKR